MVASFTVAARNNGFSKADVTAVSLETASAYHQAMSEFAAMGVMDIWYARITEADLMAIIESSERAVKGKAEKRAAEAIAQRAAATLAKAHTPDSLSALNKLAELVDGTYRIVSQPPIVVPARDLLRVYGFSGEELQHVIHEQFRAYRASLQHDRRRLLEQFEVVDMARKVVGVGSVGTRCFIVLLKGRDRDDALFLQVKEATASVLEDHLPRSRYRQPGQRVVEGQRMMQAASDIYLGWTKGHQENRFLYWRQLRDMKGSAAVEAMQPAGMSLYARVCGWTLARAHARSGDPIAIAAYLGKSDKFDRAIVDFSARYADQIERDCRAFVKAVRSGRLAAQQGV